MALKFDLTKDQGRQVKECWAELMEKMDGLEAGMFMFMRLFELDPTLQDYFKFSKDSRNLQLKLHVRAVMATLDRCIKNLDNSKNVEENFKVLGSMHASVGIEKGQLQKLVKPFILMMEKGLQESFTDAKQDACLIFITKVAEMIYKNM